MIEQAEKTQVDFIIRPIIRRLKISGFRLENFNIWSKIWWYFMILSNVTWMILSCCHLMASVTVEDICDVVLTVTCLTQAVAAVVITRIFRKVFMEIVDNMQKQFWFHEKEVDEEIISKHKFNYRMLSNIGMSYMLCGATCIIVMFLEPVVNSTGRFPMEMMFPYRNFIKDSPFYEIIYFNQFLTVGMGAICVILMDMLYLASIGFVLMQVDLIKQRLKRLVSDNDDEKEMYGKLKECILHHNIILTVLEKIEKSNRYYMLDKILADLFCLCVTTYLFTQQQNLSFKFMLVLVISGCQPLLYCFFGDFVTSECMSIGEEAYDVNWQNNGYKSVTSALSLMILRSQKPVFMTAGGMVIFSLPNYVALEKSPMDTIINPVVSTLKLAGCHPEHFKFPAIIWWYYLFISNVIIMLLSIVHLNHLNSIEDIGDIIVNISCQTQLIAGTFSFRYYKNLLSDILNIMKTHFWFNDHNIDEKVLHKHGIFYGILSKVAKTYQSTVYIAVFSWFLEPIFNSKTKRFPMDMTFPYNNFIKESPYYEIIYFLQFISVTCTAFYVVLLSDIVYIDTVGFTLVQVDLLKQKLKKLISERNTEKEIYDELKTYVIHHNIILLSLEKIEGMYRYFMLNKFLCDIFCLCCAGYLLSMEMKLNVKLMFILVASGIQPLLYCFFGDFVTSECESIGQIAYEVNWENTKSKSVRQCLAMVILRSQKQVLMTAGGMILLSLPNYLAFMRMMFSFYILMKQMSTD